MMKKLLSLVLAMMMLLSVIPAQAAQPRAVALDTMPNWVSEVFEAAEPPAAPEIAMDYDAEANVVNLTITNGDIFGDDPYIYTFDQNWENYYGTYDETKGCYVIPLKDGVTMDSLHTLWVMKEQGNYDQTSMSMTMTDQNKNITVKVEVDDGFIEWGYYGTGKVEFTMSASSTKVQTAQGEYDVSFNCLESGLIYAYSYTDTETGNTYTFDREGLQSLQNGNIYWSKYSGWHDWSQTPPEIEKPENMPNPEDVEPLLGINNNVNNTSTLAMTNMPNNVSEIVDVGSAPEAPKFDVQHDETTGLLTIKATDGQGNPADGITLVDKNWNYTEVPGYDPATGIAVIDLAAAGLTLEDIQEINGWMSSGVYSASNGSLWEKSNSFQYDMATGDVTFSIYQLTEAGIVNFTKWDENDAYASSMEITINNGDGEQKVTLNIAQDGSVYSYSQDKDGMSIIYDAEGVSAIADYNSGVEWSRETGWCTYVFNEETGMYEPIPAEKPEGAPDPESIKAPLGAPVPVEPTEPKATWYPNNTVCVAGLYLKDTVKNLTNKWYNVVPVDISKDGSQTYTLVASGMYVIGRATVTVKGDDVTVTYKYPQGYIEPQSETLAWFTDIDQITTEYLNNPTGNARFGRKVSKANDLNGQDIALLFICNRVTYRQPYYRDGGSLTRYWPNSSYNTGYVKYLKNLLDAME